MNVNATFSTRTVQVPASVAASIAGVRARLLKDGVVQSEGIVSLPSNVAVFPTPPAGTYTVSFQRVSTSGDPFEAERISAPFVVEPMVDVEVPDVVTVAL